MSEIKSGYTRVSQILNVIPKLVSREPERFDFPIQQIDKEILEAKKDLGTNVHAAIHEHTKGGFYPLNSQEQKYFDSYLKWAEAVKLKPIETELRLYLDAMMITGGIDMLAQMGDSQEWQLIDFKCTAQEDPDKWPIQGCFYSLILAQNGFPLFQKPIFVRLDRDGGFPSIYEYHMGRSVNDAMVSAYNLYKYLTRK